MLSVSHRLQITLDDRHYELLQRERRRSGASLATLVRRAIDLAYEAEPSSDQRLAWLEEGFGAWADRDDGSDPHAEWRALRPPLGPPPAA